MKKINKPLRYPLSTALKEKYYQRLMIVREHGYTIPDILVLGIEMAEKKIKVSN